MKLVAYCRTSTEEQQLGLAAQPEKFASYAKLYDHRIVELIAVNESAKSLKRSGLQRALQILRDGRADGLLVLNVDRLCRDVEGGHQLLREYFAEDAKYRKHLFSVQDHVDTRTAVGRMAFTMKLAVAQYEREAIAERTKAALAVKRRSGRGQGFVIALLAAPRPCCPLRRDGGLPTRLFAQQRDTRPDVCGGGPIRDTSPAIAAGVTPSLWTFDDLMNA